MKVHLAWYSIYSKRLHISFGSTALFFMFHHSTYLFLQELLQLGSNGVTYFRCGSLAANVTCAHTGLDDVAHGLLDSAGFVEEGKGVLHHQAD
jgi:hypothetical protein